MRGQLSVLFRPMPLVVLIALGSASYVSGQNIERRIKSGPSKTPQTRCFDHEAVEKGDVVVMKFSATIDESSPSGVKGQEITSHAEHTGSAAEPMFVQVANPKLEKGWDESLLGLCETDKAVLIVPPRFVHGEAFAKNRVPSDAVIRIDVEIVDILVENDESDSEDYDYGYDSDEDEL